MEVNNFIQQKEDSAFKTTSTKIAIFASGSGSNAERIIQYFSRHPTIKIKLIVSNKPGAGVLNHANKYHIPTLMIDKETFFRGDGYVAELKNAGIDFIVLAGFLWKVPDTIVNAFAGRIVNIHPALLPKYGGKGMYGTYVHQAVIDAKETDSGITIHYVDGKYDNGDVIFQATCAVCDTDTAESLANKIHKLEHEHFAPVIEACINKMEQP